MVYGLVAILVLEFLVPTLQVAKELEWTSHDYFQCLDKLEQLDETRLCALKGMYAQKRRKK